MLWVSQCIDSLILRLPHPLQKVIWCLCLEQEVLNSAIIMFYLPISVPAYSINSNPSFFPGFELSHLIGYHNSGFHIISCRKKIKQ